MRGDNAVCNFSQEAAIFSAGQTSGDRSRWNRFYCKICQDHHYSCVQFLEWTDLNLNLLTHNVYFESNSGVCFLGIITTLIPSPSVWNFLSGNWEEGERYCLTCWSSLLLTCLLASGRAVAWSTTLSYTHYRMRRNYFKVPLCMQSEQNRE